MPQVWSLVCSSDACVFPRLLWTESALLLQHLFLLCFDLRINLGTFRRLVAVILGLVGTEASVGGMPF